MTETSTAGRPWADRFLEQLRKYGTIAGAAKATKVGRSTVYEELQRNQQFAAEVKAVQDECVELVEATLYECALDPEGPTRWRDRLTYLKARKPDLYGDKLRADQVAAIKAEGRRDAIAELQRDVAALPPEARKIVMAAMGNAVQEPAAKELAP
jgi:hypothetical protein